MRDCRSATSPTSSLSSVTNAKPGLWNTIPVSSPTLMLESLISMTLMDILVSLIQACSTQFFQVFACVVLVAHRNSSDNQELNDLEVAVADAV